MWAFRLLSFPTDQKGTQPLSSESLFNLSPLDGRYAEDLQDLQEIFSEAGLIKTRVRVELVYLKYFLQATGRADWWQGELYRPVRP